MTQPRSVPSAREDDSPVAPGTAIDRAGIDEPSRRALESALSVAVRGEVCFDTSTQAVYSADASNYRQIPLGVVFPVDHEDVISVIETCRKFNAPVLGRGAGTSLAGQSCNVAVILDFSRHMNRVLEIDAGRRIARVQPGVVLDDLQAELAKVGLTFGPDPATHAYCTIGGMIANNSCGTHALYAGKTVDNIAALRIASYEGIDATVASYDDAAYGAVVAEGGPLATVLGGLRELSRRYGELIAQRYPDIPRRVSGYNLDQLAPEAGFNVARALVGTESTCVLVTEATLLLSERPAERRLVVIGYPDVYQAADAVPSLLAADRMLCNRHGVEHALLGLEGFDDTLVRQSRNAGLNAEGLALLPPGGGWLLAELGARDPETADRLVADFLATIPASFAVERFDSVEDQGRVWSVRESALGATAHPPNERPNHEGWEDAAVDPVHLGSYLRAIHRLWQEFGYSGAWYGHFGQGCVHTRNNFTLDTREGLADYRRYLERAADICVSFGGSLSGEHGDGQGRGELLVRMFGPELIEAFRMFKAIWDPRGRMNPGKIVDPYPLDTNLRHGPAYRKTQLNELYYSFPQDGGSLQMAADRCVGVGRCRRDDSGVMCPSFRVTRDETHSTRGRARLLAEMMQGEITPESWQNADVRAALDLCLGCKGCAIDCPTHVDMAIYKSEFMAHYYAKRRRPRVDYAFAMLPWALRIGSSFPRLANLLVGDQLFGRAVRRTAGVTTARPAPKLAAKPFRRSDTAARHAPGRTGKVDAKLFTVVVWPDTFSNSFHPEMVQDTVQILETVGERVVVPDAWACCGRTLYDAGLLDKARTTLQRLVEILTPYVDAGLHIVVPEPSCLAAFRDELPRLLATDPRAARLAAAARSVSEHLLESGTLATVEVVTDHASQERVLIHPHCHGRAVGTPSADRKVLETLGYRVKILDAGCCGLAGAFGYNPEHEPIARKIAEHWWLPKLHERAKGSTLVIDGLSCALQLEQIQETPRDVATSLPKLLLSRLRTAPRQGARE
jgi:FAD/FMN-containing dehydrogenase/Fe-S oxidoreductase